VVTLQLQWSPLEVSSTLVALVPEAKNVFGNSRSNISLANLPTKFEKFSYFPFNSTCFSYNEAFRLLADVSYFFCFLREAKEIGDVCVIFPFVNGRCHF